MLLFFTCAPCECRALVCVSLPQEAEQVSPFLEKKPEHSGALAFRIYERLLSAKAYEEVSVLNDR